MSHLNSLIRAGLIGVAVLAGGHALAQSASAPATAASQPQAVPRYGQIYTPGWVMMSKDERTAYAAAMGQLKNRGECVGLREATLRTDVATGLAAQHAVAGHARVDLCDVLPN